MSWSHPANRDNVAVIIRSQTSAVAMKIPDVGNRDPRELRNLPIRDHSPKTK